MPVIYGKSPDGLNRKAKTIWCKPPDSVNHKVKHIWGKDGSGVNQKIFSGAIEWSYILQFDASYVSLLDDNNHAASMRTSIQAATVYRSARIIYTFSDPLIFPIGSTIQSTVSYSGSIGNFYGRAYNSNETIYLFNKLQSVLSNTYTFATEKTLNSIDVICFCDTVNTSSATASATFKITLPERLPFILNFTNTSDQ